MTLILIWRDGPNLAVIADTLFRSRGTTVVELGPKVFSTPIRTRRLPVDGERLRHHPDMGFAFAGNTSAGQFAHSAASAGLSNLLSTDDTFAEPTVEAVAGYYARCSIAVIEAMRQHYASDQFLFEGLVFGWAGQEAEAYTFETRIDDQARVIAEVQRMNFNTFGLYAIGQGSEQVQMFLEESTDLTPKPTGYDLMRRVIKSDDVPSVGGRVQAALVSDKGAELKEVLLVGSTGHAHGGFMGLDTSKLGSVDGYVPMNSAPVVLEA